MARRPAIAIGGGALLAWVCGLGLVLGEEPQRPPLTVLFTPGFRVRVETTSVPAGQVYSTWAEQFLHKLHRLMQWEIRALPDRTMTIRQYPAEEGRVGMLTEEQPVAGQVEQILSVFGMTGTHREILEELLTEAGLERRVIDRMTPAARQKGIPAVPRWLSVGLARYLDPELRARDARWVGDSIEAGVWPQVTEWVTWRKLPQGYAEEKSFSCQAIAWILSRPTGPAGVHGLLDTLAMGRQIEVGQIALRLNFASVAEAEADWKKWLDRQGRVVRFGVNAPSDMARRLRAHFIFSDEELSLAGVPSDLDLTWAGLIDHRGKIWVRKLTARKADMLRLMVIGKDRELRDLVAEAVVYLETCGGSRIWPLKSVLRRRYGELERKFTQFEKVVSQREDYVDRVEAAGPGEPAPEYEQGLEKSALRDYVDRVESNLTVGVPPSPQR